MPDHSSLAHIIRRLRSRELRSVDLVEVLLARLDRLNPTLNMVLLRRDDDVRREAVAADALLDRGEPRGLLEGVPITVKDSLDTAGIRTTSGCLHRADRVPTEDAETVRRLREAGAIVLAKSNTPELAFSLETSNVLVGRTHNPWQPSRTVGGSSGGEAALLASRCSLLGLGSDFGGSLRLPAHFCGVAALKPTSGALPNHGHPPRVPEFMQSLAVIGPLARSVRDIALGWFALREEWSTVGRLIDRPDEVLSPRPATVRVVFAEDRRLSSRCAEALVQAAEALASRGYRVERCEAPGLLEVERLWEQVVMSDGGEGLRNLLSDGQPWSPGLELARGLVGRARRHADLLFGGMAALRWRGLPLAEALARRDAILAELAPLLAPDNLLLAPVAPAVAHAAFNRLEHLKLSPYLRGPNVLGLPALAVPVVHGAPGQLPIGVQLIGGAFEEHALLRVGAQLEDSLPPMR